MRIWNKLTVCVSVVMITTMAFFVVVSPKASAGTPVGGYIDSDTTWNFDGSPYWVEKNVVIRNGANLTIEIGVDVLFNGSYSIYVEAGGVLWIQQWWTQIDYPYALFSWNTVHGDPYPGRWGAIQFNDSSYDSSSIMKSVIEYATNGVRLESASPTIHNNTIRNCTYGIVSSYGSPTIENNIIENCTRDGIRIVGNDPGGGGYANIANNTITNNGRGIRLEYSSNNNIVNNNVSNNEEDGIRLIYYSNNNIIANNTVSSSDWGIHILYYSNNNIIANNTVSSNIWCGIRLLHSSSNTLTNNTMLGDGILVSQGALVYWNTHTIDTTNTVNGKPVYYWKNRVGGTVPSGAGEVILANCIDVIVENQNVSDGSVGIELGFSSGTKIANNTASSNDMYGILLYQSSYNSITNNTASNNGYGMYLQLYTSYNNITNNTFSNNDYGIGIAFALHNNITNNNISSNDYDGIALYSDADYNIIYNNTIAWNGRAGINCDGDSDPTIELNDIRENTYGISLYYYSDAIIDNNNTIAYNTQGIYCVYYSSPTITWNDIHNNTDAGINSTWGSDPVIHYNNIEDNLKDLGDSSSGYGVNNRDTGIEVDATYNWWGDASGPYHWDSNPTGQGNQVSDDVDFDYYSSGPY